MCFKSIGKMLAGTVDRPSPSDVLIQGMAYLWTPSAFYIDASGRLRLKKEFVRIPFNHDPVVWPSGIPGTKSRDPVFDKEHDNLYLQGETPLDQGIMVAWLANEWQNPPAVEKPRANIIVYQTPDIYAVHRLDKIEVDNSGRKWWFKGDNNATRDPSPARDSEIQWVLVMTAL